MFYCSICKTEFIEIKKHLLEFHRPSPDPNNTGNFLCTLCNVKVGNKQRHYCSTLHRNNVGRNEVNLTYGLKEYIIHFDKYCDRQTVKAIGTKLEEDSFWSAAKKDLSKEDYKILKEYANGERGNIRRFKKHNGIHRYTRHSKLKRYSRASKCK